MQESLVLRGRTKRFRRGHDRFRHIREAGPHRLEKQSPQCRACRSYMTRAVLSPTPEPITTIVGAMLYNDECGNTFRSSSISFPNEHKTYLIRR